ncbi:MAG: AraC family transcriptional regulator [Chitinophagaceae bacterium]|nr:MAG: AraC family transcriptional regulator [Chitinophagaceae bacterium]
MKVFVRNMVCARCRLFVMAQLEALGLPFSEVGIGHANLRDPVTPAQLYALNERLEKAGLELAGDGTTVLVDQVRAAVLETIQGQAGTGGLKFSSFLAQRLGYDYSYLSHLFVSRVGTTIEHFYISEKIRKVKELLIREHLSLTEIADRMNYCSVQHLSTQFKKVTGVTPSQYKARISGRAAHHRP